MHALVTGGTGFIGSHLVERLLAAGHSVRVLARDVHKAAWLVRQGAEVHAGDVTNPVSLRSAATDVDVVFHLAAFVSEWGPWKKFEAITVAGTKNTLAAAVTAGVRRFVHISTATVYDDTFSRRARVITEDAPLGTFGDRAYGKYSKAKVLAEQAVWQMHRQGQLAVTVLRPAWVYGPRDFTIMPRMVAHLKGRLACWIGRKNPVVDPIFVTDVADCCLLAALNPDAAGEAYNVAPREEIGLRQFLTAMCTKLNLRPPTWTLPYSLAYGVMACCEGWGRMTESPQAPALTTAALATFTVDQHFDPSKAIQHLRWNPVVSLEVGLSHTANWLSSVQLV